MATIPPELKAIFCEALEIPSEDERRAYLDRACAGAPDLRARVDALLLAHQDAGSFLKQPVQAPSFTWYALNPVEAPGTIIGPYKLLQQIGEGGMGAVYMAEQEKPVRRKVALKIIKPGMDSRQVIARFEAERQALAMMDHPNIARVLDAGLTEGGRPYFVMELVHGEPITQFCDDNHLTPRERLALFVPVCRAIQHAHQKGIIHRDVKPSNVLVTMYDDVPVPKVIDFGVAKAIEQRLTEKTLFTQFGALVGTFEYMSPEQAEMNALGVDTGSDIYSLGVLLYELLTGTTPLEHARLRSAALHELVRLIKEQEAPRPSVRLSGSDLLPKIAAARRTEPRRLPRLVRGELDWIVMKCLEKDRTRRYETASGLARDVERYLGDEPVEAGPPSAGYRLRKLARKHQGLLMTAAAFAALLLVAAVVSTWLAVRATRAERAAARRLGEARQANAAATAALAATRKAQAATRVALEQSERGRTQAEAVSTFLTEAFRSPDPSRDGREVKVADVLDRAVEKLDAGLAGSPATKGALLDALGRTYLGLGLADRAIRTLERARAVCDAVLDPDHADTLQVRNDLASAYWKAGRTAEAIALHEATLKQRETRLGPDHPDTLTSRNNLASAYLNAGRTAEAIALHEATLKQRETRLGPDHPDTLNSRNNLAMALRAAGRTAEAIALHEATLKQRETRLGPDHPDTLTSRNNLATAYWSVGRLDRSIPLFERGLEQRAAKLGPDHPETLRAQVNLGVNYRDAGRLEEGARLIEDALRRAGGRPDALAATAWVAPQLAATYLDLGRPDRAEALLRDVLSRQRGTEPRDSPALAATMAQLGLTLLQQRKWSEAEPILRECLKIGEAKLPEHWSRFNAMSQLGGSLLGQGRFAEAEPLLICGYEGLKARAAMIPPNGRARLAEAVERLVRLSEAQGRPAQAEWWRRQRRDLALPADPFGH
jgi:serine/threonine protein kinase/tetratricopeptide (TPR) repeat protein